MAHEKTDLAAGLFNGRGDRIRTCDLYVPNVALYQTELHPEGVPSKKEGKA
jgi:hypothetical protein